MPTPAYITHSELHSFTSTCTGREYRIYVILPESYEAGEKRYPVLYGADANLAAGMMTDIVRLLAFGGEIPELILVGVGYPTDSMLEAVFLRNTDLTPTDYPMMRQLMSSSYGERAFTQPLGEADKFLRFLHEELQPYINANYRTIPEDRGLYGDSLSGLFGCYVLLHKPEAFNRYIIGSPSLWATGGIALNYVEAYAAQHADLPARVFMGVGGLEEDPNDPLLAQAKMVTNMKQIAEELVTRSFPSLRLTSYIFEGETHQSVISSNISRGLRSVYDPATPPAQPEA